MKRILFAVTALFLVNSVYSQPLEVSAVKIGNRIDVNIMDEIFTSYRCYPDEKHPFFFPVNGPVSGSSLTSMRNKLYPHHSSMFFGCDMVNGGNYWHEGFERGRIISLGARIIEAGGSKVVIEDECIWKRPDADAPIIDRRKITVSAPSKDLYQLDFDIELEMLTDVTIKKTNHSLFTIRFISDLAVAQGGTMFNAEGKKNQEETNGVVSPWMDYYGTLKTGTEGIALLQHPSNTWYPEPWLTRDYGLFSPATLQYPKDDKETVLKKGEKVKFRYRILVHGGTTEQAGISKCFEQYKNE
ncbi:MAG: PmoA family protein [Tannerella sp.]|jgi:hypothetical protein|nr:PmoA family protein [Tannerella sp.]